MIAMSAIVAIFVFAVLLMPRSDAAVQLHRPLELRKATPSEIAARTESVKALAALWDAWSSRQIGYDDIHVEFEDFDTASTLPPPSRKLYAILPPPPRVPHVEQYREIYPKAA